MIAWKRMGRIAGGLLFIALMFAPLFFSTPLSQMTSTLSESGRLSGAALFIGAMFAATVIAPVAVLPLVPLAATIFGPLPTALYAILGWWSGALVAFMVARFGGRPLLARLVPLEKFARYERKIPGRLSFWGLVCLRMMVPVDILSYAVGLVSTIRFASYALATLIGIIPFAFIFAYSGALLAGAEYARLGILGVAASVLLGIAWRTIYRMRENDAAADAHEYRDVS